MQTSLRRFPLFQVIRSQRSFFFVKSGEEIKRNIQHHGRKGSRWTAGADLWNLFLMSRMGFKRRHPEHRAFFPARREPALSEVEGDLARIAPTPSSRPTHSRASAGSADARISRHNSSRPLPLLAENVTIFASPYSSRRFCTARCNWLPDNLSVLVATTT